MFFIPFCCDISKKLNIKKKKEEENEQCYYAKMLKIDDSSIKEREREREQVFVIINAYLVLSIIISSYIYI